MRPLIVAWGLVAAAAALWTGAAKGFALCSMTGLLPPHYGYSAYAISALTAFAPWRGLRWVAWGALLASQNRAACVGALIAWGLGGGRRHLALASILGVLAVIGGAALKPYPGNDSIRVQIWKAALRSVERHPLGVGRGGFYVGVGGRATGHAHSDVLQVAVEWGIGALFLVAAGAVLTFSVFWLTPPNPWKAVWIGLAFQSVIDNRFYASVPRSTLACAGLFAAVWLCAVLGPTEREG